MVSALFVYGTLMPGHLRWGILAPHALDHRPAVVAGTLFDTGQGWPAASFAASAGGSVPDRDLDRSACRIPGWLISLDPSTCPTLLAQLDEIEGVAPEGATADLHLRDRYHRVVVATVAGASAWAYEAALVEPTWPAIEGWAGQAEQ